MFMFDRTTGRSILCGLIFRVVGQRNVGEKLWNGVFGLGVSFE